MESLQLFNFKGQEVRAVVIDNEPWFVAKDVCNRLNIAWTGKQTLSSLPDSWIRVRSFLTPQGNQDLIIISEAGMYKFAFRSNKEEAEEFTNWVAGDVIPTLRKAGKYELGLPSNLLPYKVAEIQATESVFKSFHEIGTLAGFEGNQLILSANTATRKVTGIDSLELMDSVYLPAEKQEVLLTPTEVGKRIGVSTKKINPLLEERGLQKGYRDHKNRQRWELTEFGKKEYAEYQDTGKKHSDGSPRRAIKWYESVVDFLLKEVPTNVIPMDSSNVEASGQEGIYGQQS